MMFARSIKLVGALSLLVTLFVSLTSASPAMVTATATVPKAPTLAPRDPHFSGVTVPHITVKTPVIKSPHIPTPTCTQTIIPDKNGYVPPDSCHALYRYYPSFGAALAATVLFGVATIVQIAQAAHYKKVRYLLRFSPLTIVETFS